MLCSQKRRVSGTGEKLLVSPLRLSGRGLFSPVNVIFHSADTVVYLTRKTRGGFRKCLISIGAFSDSWASVNHISERSRTNEEERKKNVASHRKRN